MDSSHSWRCRDKGQLSRQSDINPNRVAVDPITPITVYSITGTRGNGDGWGHIVTIISTAGIVQSGTILPAVIRLIIREHPGSRGGQLPRLLIPPSEAALKLTDRSNSSI